MGTTLTGTTPQDTYDSLIKVTDNGPLSGTAKYLSDGLGNDSALALSTTAVGIGTNNPVDTIGYGRALDIQSATGAAIYLRDSDAPTTDYAFVAFDANDDGLKINNQTSSGFIRFNTNSTEKMRITSTGNVGIGTSSPSGKLHAQDINGGFLFDGSGATYNRFKSTTSSAAVGRDLLFSAQNSGTTPDLYITSAGNVGIGTDSPTAGYKLDLRGRAITYNSGYLADFVSTDSNASAIQLYADNTNVSIVQGGTSAVPMTFFIGGSERMRITSAGNVGIGTSSPISKLNIDGGTGDTTANDTILSLTRTSSTSNVLSGKLVLTAPNTYSQNLVFRIKTTASSAEDPSYYSDIVAITNNGLTFNGDTAAANALDDYEEGTWTMGLLFGGASTGITYFLNGGTYTKIGRKVTVNGILSLTNKGSATGDATLTGLPFTIGTGFTYYSAPATTASAITSTGSIQGRGGSASTIINLEQHDPASGANASLTNANFANNSDITISFTYFV